MAIIEKKAFLGVQKKRLKNKRNKKKYNLLDKVLDYLKFDCCLFAPLTSSNSDFRSHKIEMKENAKENKKKLVKKVGEYLISDSYMYAPLVVPPKPLWVPTKGPQRYTKHVTVEVARRSISLKETTRLANKQSIIPARQSLAHKETVKHAIYQNCRSSSGHFL
ncbi:hypothetical protein L484_023018 [Morus notabilis]|uniref:Uncharacterized protein n=1 Tax=Morus notabilis TaxID=981085 RepID=W9RKH4_9ROSA|nr:hypothetical protein L484_023018 [Morus notabilis]